MISCLTSIDLRKIETGLPPVFEGTKLYGEAQEEKVETNSDCRVYQLGNETGTGKITAYQVFTGIELYYNDLHLAYCSQDQDTAKNRIEINHCMEGRYECGFGENSCCYMSAGDLSIGSAMKKKSYSCFPFKNYRGITVLIDLDRLLPEIQQIMGLLSIDLDHIRQYICDENRCCIMRTNPFVQHIFTELYHVRERRKSGYIKVKVLELLLFLSDLDIADEVLQTDYYNKDQVKLVKAVEACITEDIAKHYTIEMLSEKFEISPTALKKCFHGVYGTSIYSYLRIYRLQTARKLLLETELPVTEIAHKIGYENPNKFASAFKAVYGSTPSDFRKSVHLDR